MVLVKSLVGGSVLLAVALALQKGRTITNIEFAMWLIIVAMSAAGFGGALFFLEGIKKIGNSTNMLMLLLTRVFGTVILPAWPINNGLSRYCDRVNNCRYTFLLVGLRH
jgi:hypothetical protein